MEFDKIIEENRIGYIKEFSNKEPTHKFNISEYQNHFLNMKNFNILYISVDKGEYSESKKSSDLVISLNRTFIKPSISEPPFKIDLLSYEAYFEDIKNSSQFKNVLLLYKKEEGKEYNTIFKFDISGCQFDITVESKTKSEFKVILHYRYEFKY